MRRLEPTTRSHGIETGLAARTHDPLWLLARQWQLGEFMAEDAASPASVDVVVEVHPVDRWRPAGDDSWRPYAVAEAPLEELVEREPGPGPSPRLRLDGGLRLRRSLHEAGLDDLLAAFVASCPFLPAGPAPGPAPDTLAATLRDRLPDGSALAGPLARLADPASAAEACVELGLPDGAAPALTAVAADWLTWWVPRAGPGAAAPPASGASAHPETWDEHRLEHRFELSSSTLDGTVLRASAYEGGRLDWWSVDAVAAVDPAPDPVPAALLPPIVAVPSPARFGGMPVPRFWEMEDARFDPGAIDAGPLDLGRLLVATFATVYGNDWFVLPLPLPVASIARVTSFTVHDVFGGVTTVDRTGAADDGWNLFGLTRVDSERVATGERPTSEWFFLAPGLASTLDGPPVERVLFLRDEVANVGWAVEATVADDAGGLVDRTSPTRADRPAGAADGPAADGPATVGRYRVQTDVPHHWYPLVAEPLEDHEAVRLRVVPLARSDDGGGAGPSLPLGQVLGALRHDGETAWLHEEEVPSAGLLVVRSHQRARWYDGSVRTWIGRRATTGAGQASSGLRFDVVTPP